MRVFPWVKLFWHSCSLWDRLGWLNWFRQFFCEGLSSISLKGFCHSYAWSCKLCEGGLPFARDLSLENSVDSYWCFRLALLQLVSYFIFRYWSPSLSLCTIFYTISFNTDELLSINPSAVFAFKDCLTYSGGTDRPDEPRYNFSMKWPPQIVNFSFGFLAVTLRVLFFWIYFFFLMQLFVLQWLSLHKEILIMLLCQFPLTFHQSQNGMPLSLHSLWLFLAWLGWPSWSSERYL